MKKLLCMILALLIIASSLPSIITSYADDSVNLLADASHANGAVTWDGDIDVRSSIIDSASESVYGGYSWTFGLGNCDHQTVDPRYVYIKASGLTMGTNYDFSYTYQLDYKFAIESIKTADGQVASFTTPETSNVSEKARSYKVSTTFTVPVNGDYIITLKTGKYSDMRTSDCSWDVVVLGDLSLTKGVAATNILEKATYANGDVSWTTTTDVDNRIGDIGAWGGSNNDNTSKSVNGGYAWVFGLGDGQVGGDRTYTENKYKETYAYIYIKAKGLTANTRYDFSFIYQYDYAIALDNVTDKNSNVVQLEVAAQDVAIEGGTRAHQVSTTFLAPVDGDYTITLKTNRTMHVGSEWNYVVLSDLVLIKSTTAAKVAAEVLVSGNGDVEISDELPAVGSTVTYTAIPWQGEEFLGWYKGDEKINDNLSYSFVVTEKTTLIAKFSSKSLNVLAGKKASDWTGYQWSTVTDSTESKDGGKGYLVNKAMWQSIYTKVTLKPNTEYKLSFNWKSVNDSNPAFPNDIKVCSASEVDIEDRATNWQDGNFAPVNATDLERGENYASEEAAKTFTWQTLQTGFTTTSATDYNIVIYFTVSSGNHNQAINLSDFVLEEVNPTPPDEPDEPTIPALSDKTAADWRGVRWSVISDSTEATPNGGKAYRVDKAMSQNINTTLALKPNTQYKISFSWKAVANEKGLAYLQNAHLYSAKSGSPELPAKNESDANWGAACNYKFESWGDYTPTYIPNAGYSDLITDVVNDYNSADTSTWTNWNGYSANFTTTADTEYYFFVNFGLNGSNGNQAVIVGDFVLEEVNPEPPVEPEEPDEPTIPALSDKTASDWKGYEWAEITDSTESKDGGKGYLVNKAMWQSIYTKLVLEPNAEYKLSFNWKGVANDKAVAFPDSIKVFAANAADIEDRATNWKDGGDFKPANATDLEQGGNYADETLANTLEWQSVTTTFTTTTETEYNLIVHFAINSSTNNNNQAINLSDFVLEKIGGGDQPDEPDEPTIPALSDKTAADWRGVRWSVISDSTEATPNGGKAYRVDSAMCQNINTTLALKPNTQYKISFSWKAVANEKGLAYLQNAHLYSAKSGSPELPAKNESDANWGAACNYKFESWGDYTPTYIPNAGYSDLITDVVNDYNSADTSTWTNWNGYSAKFTTTADTEYYFFVNFDLHGENHKQSVIVGDFVLEELGAGSVTPDEPDEPAVSDLSEKDASEWDGYEHAKISNSTDSKNGGKAYLVKDAMWQSIHTKLKLKPQTIYNLSFNWKSVANSECVAYPDVIKVYSAIAADIEDRANNWKDGGTYAPKTGEDLELGGNYTDEDKAKTLEWQSITTTFSTKEDSLYDLVIHFNIHGAANHQEVKLSDFVLEEVGPAVEVEEDKDNLAAKYTAAAGNIQWTELADAWSSDSYQDSKTISVYGGYGWTFGLANSDYEKAPAYVMVKTHELEANHKYEFQYIYQGDFIIDFDSIDADAVVTLQNDAKLLEGDRAHRITIRFETKKAGVHTITLKMGKGKNNENCQWSNAILCDLKLYDITNRVYGTVKSDLGGTITGFDTPYCLKGDKIVLTATPRSGNEFVGWYDENGKLVSDKLVFEFTAEKDFNYHAVFSGSNIPNADWLEQHGMDGTFENGLMDGWKAEDRADGDDTSWASFERTTEMAYNGDYSLRMRSRYRTTLYNFTDLKKSTNYLLSFYINQPDLYIPMPSEDAKAETYNIEALIRSFNIVAGGAVLYSETGSSSNPAIKGGSGWHKVNIYFNTADHTSVEWNFIYTNKNNAKNEFVYMDDVSLTEYTSNAFTNGNFASGAAPWRGEFSVANGAAVVSKGNSVYQNANLGTQSYYTVSFKAKGKGVAGAAQMTAKPIVSSDYITSESVVNLNSTDWKTYSFKLFTGINPDVSIFFNSTEGNLLVDDVTIVKAVDRSGAIVEKIDFESDRFALKVDSDVFEIYNGKSGDANVHSGTKSLRFNSAKAKKDVSYILEEAFVSFQVVSKINYKLTMYYKTTKGNSVYLAPEYLPDEDVTTVYTAADNGWTKVDFMFNKPNATYVKAIIGNVLGKTNADFYIDDITLSVTPPMVLETNSVKKYCEWPLNVLNNEGFEKQITNDDWAKLPTTAVVRNDNGANGKNYLRVSGTKYVLPVQLEASDSYYFSISSRVGANASGYVAITDDPAGTKLYNDINEKPASKIAVDSANWNRDSFLFSTSETGLVYLVFYSDKGYIDLDDVHIYKRQYGWETDPNDHTEFVPYNYDNPDPSTIVYNGGDPTYGGVIDPDEFY